MKIIETAKAPNPRRVRIFLAEKGIPMAFEEHDLMQNPFGTPELTALNPWQRVPILIFDDGRSLSESIAICRYFEEIQPDPPLFGEGAWGRASVEMWNRRAELGLFAAVTEVFRHLHPRMANLEVPQVGDWGRANVSKVNRELDRLDAQLAQSPFLAGNFFSVADITLLVAIDFMKPAKLAVSDHYANVRRWHADVSSRASASA